MHLLYPTDCQQPNFVSKNGKILAVLADGTETQIDIKGVNWLGMQDNKGVPKGLWDNTREGSTLYRVGAFLSSNNFNAVRLPLTVDSVMRNVAIDSDLINTNSNRALDGVTNYLKMLSLVVQGLGQFKIGVVLDFHLLSAVAKEDASGLWYGTSIQLNDIKTAIDALTKQLCNGKHFNIIGLDLKDSLGASATWGDGSETDWAVAATTLGNYMLKSCPKWLAFVQGVQGSAHKDVFDGNKEIKNKFLAGSDLTGLAKAPISLATSGKVVYAPKYYTSSFLPQPYFFDKSTSAGDMLKEYTESPDATLKKNVLLNMDYMFGAAFQTGAAVVLSSFGGLLGAADLTDKKTSTRIANVVMDRMLASDKSLAGGFYWTLNPDTYWPYPAPDNSNATSAGLIDETWRAANMDVLTNLAKMDKMASVKFVPCVAA